MDAPNDVEPVPLSLYNADLNSDDEEMDDSDVDESEDHPVISPADHPLQARFPLPRHMTRTPSQYNI